jgi:septal ring factor EnvC (AmiA/AmiB activator)
MELMEALRNAIQDWVIPELDKLHLENAEIRTTLSLTNKRLDDIQQQLIDQSRRIDDTNKRIDDSNTRIDRLREDLLARIDETHRRMDRLYEVIVRRDEHVGLERWVRELDRKVETLERRLAA